MAQSPGYLIINHHASPGVPKGYFRERGFDMPEVPEGKVGEFDVLRCAHCPQTLIKNPERTRERASCQKCSGHYICDVCEWKSRQPDYVHMPFKRVIDDTLEAAARLSQAEPNLILPPHLK